MMLPTLTAMMAGVPQPAPMTPREEANRAVVFAYRNGPIEGYHGGTYSHGSELPGFKRLYADEVRRLGAHATGQLDTYFEARDELSAGQLALFMKGLASTHGWSVTDETSPVEYPGLPALWNY